jgi:iron-sulfur cluster repair protein YtfE (RIC family)
MTASEFLNSLRSDHRGIETCLDRMLSRVEGLSADDVPKLRQVFEQVCHRLAPHLAKEEDNLYPALKASIPSMAGKMEGQHAHLSELEEYLDELLAAAGEAPGDHTLNELQRCGRHFCALLQHHLIEEERDVFPLVERLLARDQLL